MDCCADLAQLQSAGAINVVQHNRIFGIAPRLVECPLGNWILKRNPVNGMSLADTPEVSQGIVLRRKIVERSQFSDHLIYNSNAGDLLQSFMKSIENGAELSSDFWPRYAFHCQLLQSRLPEKRIQRSCS